MEQLPSEMLMAVCELLDVRDIASLRLVSKYLCQVATIYLMSAIHVVFKPESFKRLVTISKHPVLSQPITSILHEPDMLRAMD